MKKLVLMFVAIAAISFASCADQKANQDAPKADSTMNNSAMNDSTQTPADTAKTDTVK